MRYRITATSTGPEPSLTIKTQVILLYGDGTPIDVDFTPAGWVPKDADIIAVLQRHSPHLGGGTLRGAAARCRSWISELDRWAAKHGITRLQALRVLEDEGEPSARDLRKWREADLFSQVALYMERKDR